MPLAWVPYADRAEAERRLNGIPAGLELDFYRADGDELPGSLDEVAFYVLPYMKGPAVLERAADMPKLRVVQTLTAGYEEFLPLVHPIEELHRLLPQADVTFVIAPHTPQTDGMIGARELALLPDGALLVNVARGKLVQTDALVAELTTGRIRAALDVTDPEPLPADHPLWRQPGVLISPHVGGASSAFFPRADRLMAAQLDRFIAGQPLENIVKPG